jgi:hypothetical protein
MKKSFLTVALLGVLSSLGCGSGPGIHGIVGGTGNYSNASLNGSYVYHLSGIDVSTNTFYQEAGVFTADGNGHITGGIDDATEGTQSAFGNTTSGTYTIAGSGTGTINLIGTAFSSTTLAVTLVSSSKAYLIEADALNAAGVAELQSPSTIGTAPSGTFVFQMHTTAGQISTASVGQFTVSAGVFQNGSVDVNHAGAFSSPTLTNFTLNPPISNGRGTGTFTENSGSTFSFFYYIVDANNIRFLSTDTLSNSGGFGRAESQSTGPFTASSFSGTYAFSSRGDDNFGVDSVNTVGEFTASAGAISSGAFDSVEDGTPLTNVPISGGTYQVTSNGRVTVTLTSTATANQIFWMVSPSRAFFLTANNTSDGSLTEDGIANLQATGGFSNSSITGQFALVMNGFTPNFFIDRVGTLQWDGAGNLQLNELVNDTGTVNTPRTLTGTYSVSANGRVTGTINTVSVNPNDLVFYMISKTDGYVLQEDSGTELIGAISQQH